MISQKFEIKVALLGYVSVGKTTILNAMFRDKFSEVSMRRTTAGINFFRIVTKEDQLSDEDKKEENKRNTTAAGSQSDQWSVIPDEKSQKAEDVLKQIEASNQELRKANKIEEKHFNIDLDQNLCKMRKDTSLVVVDIPGVNEADTDSIYMDYAEANWDSFDCVVVVMDARQGVNTEEQVSLLKFVKRNLKMKKNLPIIILCNKVDDPDEIEQAILVNEARQKVAEIFEVGCREDALVKALESAALDSVQHPAEMFPVFIATSATHAFFYRSASRLTFEQFKEKVDKDLIDKIGREEVGRFTWRKLSDSEKYQAVFKAVQDDSKYVERFEATSFNKFLHILSLSLGGAEMQLELLRKQVDVDIKSLSSENCNKTKLRSMYDKCLLLHKDMAILKQKFWSLYNDSKKGSMSAFEESMEGVDVLAEPLKLLMEYLAFIRLVGWKEEEARLKAASEEFFRLQLGVVVSKLDIANHYGSVVQGKYCSSCRNKRKVPQDDSRVLSPFDWLSIVESLLLMSHNATFCETFGREKVMLSKITCKLTKWASSIDLLDCPCPECKPYLMKIVKTISTFVAMAFFCCIIFMESDSIQTGTFLGVTSIVTILFCICNVTFCPDCSRLLGASDCQKKRFEDWGVHYEFAKETNHEFNKFKEEGSQIEVPKSLSDEKHWGHVAWSVCKLLSSLND